MDNGDQTIQIYNNRNLTVGTEDCNDGSQTIYDLQQRTATGDQNAPAERNGHDHQGQPHRSTSKRPGTKRVTIKQGKRTVTVQGNDTHEVKTRESHVNDQSRQRHPQSQDGQSGRQDRHGQRLARVSMGNQTTKLDLGASSTEAMQSITLKVGQIASRSTRRESRSRA